MIIIMIIAEDKQMVLGKKIISFLYCLKKFHYESG